MSANKIYSNSDQDFTEEWVDRWSEFSHLIFALLITDRPYVKPYFIPHPPTEDEQLKHKQLRTWFIEHAERLIPLWADYYEAKLVKLEADDDTPYIHWLNPFAMFYEPENLYEMAHAIHLQNSRDVWKPNEADSWNTCMILFRQGLIARTFYSFICGDEDENTSVPEAPSTDKNAHRPKTSFLNTEEQQLVMEWTIKYEDFINALMDIVLKPQPPEETEKLQYAEYRTWLTTHETTILPHWQMYLTWQEKYVANQQGQDGDYGFNPSLQCPIDYFYKPEDPYRCSALLNLAESPEKWGTNQSHVGEVIELLAGASLQIARFREWAFKGNLCLHLHWRQKVNIGHYTLLTSSYDGLVFGSSNFNNKADIDPVPDFGICLANLWSNQVTSYPKTVIDWPDEGMIDIPLFEKTVDSILKLLESGKKVDIAGCRGHGRTGTVLACLLIELEHLGPDSAIKTIRDRYCEFAVETPEQEQLVAIYYQNKIRRSGEDV